jgi:hypothetical protein
VSHPRLTEFLIALRSISFYIARLPGDSLSCLPEIDNLENNLVEKAKCPAPQRARNGSMFTVSLVSVTFDHSQKLQKANI